MARRIQKVGANTSCPCGSLKKYKACCRGHVDWETILTQGPSTLVRHLTTGGKNRLFLNRVLDALQLDTEGPIDLPDFKRAFTSGAVRTIFEAVQFVWPDGEDLKRVLRRETEQASGLYIGRYEPELVRRGLARHSLYADRILLVDPLVHPRSVRDEFNPLLHPEMHRTSTLKWISLWISLLPWINEGIVGFVRAPGDFYPELALASYETTHARFDRHPELRALMDQEAAAERGTDRYQAYLEQIMLTMPDSKIRAMASKEIHTPQGIDKLLAYVQERREAHPGFLRPERPNEGHHELHQISTGTNYEQAKLIALHSNSYVMTDLRVRWREIELDRSESGIDSGAWSSFAKAFDGCAIEVP